MFTNERACLCRYVYSKQVKHVLQVTTDRPMQVVLLHNVNSIAEYTRLSIILKDNFQRVTLYPEIFSNHMVFGNAKVHTVNSCIQYNTSTTNNVELHCREYRKPGRLMSFPSLT